MRKIDRLEQRLDEMLRVYPSFPPPWFTSEFANLCKELTHERERLAIREAAFEEAARFIETRRRDGDCAVQCDRIMLAEGIRGLK